MSVAYMNLVAKGTGYLDLSLHTMNLLCVGGGRGGFFFWGGGGNVSCDCMENQSGRSILSKVLLIKHQSNQLCTPSSTQLEFELMTSRS